MDRAIAPRPFELDELLRALCIPKARRRPSGVIIAGDNPAVERTSVGAWQRLVAGTGPQIARRNAALGGGNKRDRYRKARRPGQRAEHPTAGFDAEHRPIDRDRESGWAISVKSG